MLISAAIVAISVSVTVLWRTAPGIPCARARRLSDVPTPWIVPDPRAGTPPDLPDRVFQPSDLVSRDAHDDLDETPSRPPAASPSTGLDGAYTRPSPTTRASYASGSDLAYAASQDRDPCVDCLSIYETCAGDSLTVAWCCSPPYLMCVRKDAQHAMCLPRDRARRNIANGWDGMIVPCGETGGVELEDNV